MRAGSRHMTSLLAWADHNGWVVTRIEPDRIELLDPYERVEITMRTGSLQTYGEQHRITLLTYLSRLKILGSSYDRAPDEPPQKP